MTRLTSRRSIAAPVQNSFLSLFSAYTNFDTLMHPPTGSCRTGIGWTPPHLSDLSADSNRMVALALTLNFGSQRQCLSFTFRLSEIMPRLERQKQKLQILSSSLPSHVGVMPRPPRLPSTPLPIRSEPCRRNTVRELRVFMRKALPWRVLSSVKIYERSNVH